MWKATDFVVANGQGYDFDRWMDDKLHWERRICPTCAGERPTPDTLADGFDVTTAHAGYVSIGKASLTNATKVSQVETTIKNPHQTFEPSSKRRRRYRGWWRRFLKRAFQS